MKNGNGTKKRSRTDWKRIDAMRDSDIDLSEMPELGPEFFANAILWPGPKKQITLRIDPRRTGLLSQARQRLPNHN